MGSLVESPEPNKTPATNPSADRYEEELEAMRTSHRKLESVISVLRQEWVSTTQELEEAKAGVSDPDRLGGQSESSHLSLSLEPWTSPEDRDPVDTEREHQDGSPPV